MGRYAVFIDTVELNNKSIPDTQRRPIIVHDRLTGREWKAGWRVSFIRGELNYSPEVKKIGENFVRIWFEIDEIREVTVKEEVV